MSKEELDNIFTYHRPTDRQRVKYESLRAAARSMAGIIDTLCPDSEERSEAFRNLRSMSMWANASIACNEPEED